MSLLRQLPAWSPLTLRAILGGAWAAWFRDGRAARRELEAALRAAYAPDGLYLTDSGTSALTIALRVAESVTQAPVALPAYSCYDVATAADGAGVSFHLYDLDPATLSPDLPSLRRAFESGARTVVVAHLYGVPADLASVQELAGEFGALVIEDAAQGSGCEWKARPAGAHGALGVLSFGRGKGVTGGRGGALLVNDPGLSGAAAAAWGAVTGPGEPRGTLRDLALLVAQWLFGRPWLYWIPASLPWLGLGETTYRRPRPVGGISTLAAGVLIRTLPLVSAEVERRRAAVARWAGASASSRVFRPPSEWEAGWLRFPLVRQRTDVETDTRHLGSLGVMGGYPRPLSELQGFAGRSLNPGDAFPGSRELARRLVTVPTHRFVRSARLPAF